MSLNIKNLQTIQSGRGHGGTDFTERGIRSINICAGSRVDAIIINGHRFGGDGGHPALKDGDLVLRDNEFISRMVIKHGREVNSIEITTNQGRSLSGGDGGDNTETILTGTIVAMGGNFGERLDRLDVLGEMQVQ